MSDIRSDLGYSTADRVVVRGRDLAQDMLGRRSFSWAVFLHWTGREPSVGEEQLFDALLMTLMEHGPTPSALVARLTHLGSPEALQGAVAAGLLGLGDVFGGSAEAAASMLRRARALGGDDPATAVVAELRAGGRAIPGVGHPVHHPVDPRAQRLWELAAEHGLDGWYVQTMQRVSEVATESIGRPLPVNATGAVGALCCELQLPDGSERGLALVGRAAGLVGHVLEEAENPIAREIWRDTEREITSNAVDPGRD